VSDPTFCCEELTSAYEATFLQAIDEPTGWVLYGTDHTSVSAGEPELRYWVARHCPFCGVALPEPGAHVRRRGTLAP
jgi:hypothetical protein